MDSALHIGSSAGIRSAAALGGLTVLGQKAVDLFEQISFGPFPPLTCRDAVAPNLDEFYADSLRGSAERAVHRIGIPAQFQPVANLLVDYPEFAPFYAASPRHAGSRRP
jgi:hypothetical protein